MTAEEIVTCAEQFLRHEQYDNDDPYDRGWRDAFAWLVRLRDFSSPAASLDDATELP